MKDLTIEQRIAAALTANDIISADLAALIAEVEGAGKAADENATRAREEALDPPSWSILLRSALLWRPQHSLATDYKPHCQDCRSGSRRYANKKTSPRGRLTPRSSKFAAWRR